MNITVSKVNTWHIIHLNGAVVIRSLSEYRKVFESLQKNRRINIAIDMTHTTNIDSSAITMIINFQNNVVQNDGKLVIFGANADILTIFSIVNIHETIPLYTSRAEFEKSL